MAVPKIIRKQLIFEELPWDTAYFGVESARIILNGKIDGVDLDFIKNITKDFEFITVNNIGNWTGNNFVLADLQQIFLTDVNVQFEKKFTGECLIDNAALDSIQVSNNFAELRIIEIAAEAFKFSRFFNDPWLEKSKADNIYAYWTEQAFNREEKYFLIHRENNKVNGFILFYYDAVATIELIAVAKDAAGQGIGSRMLQQLEHFLIQHRVNKIKVGTQATNYTALNFYFKTGFKIISSNSVYHYWPKKG